MMRTEKLTNGLRLSIPDDGFALSTDSILLSHFVRLGPKARVADLGAGVGTLGLFLLRAYPDAQLVAIELQEQACRAAKQNITDNCLEDHFKIIQGDIRDIRTLCQANSFDCVVSNPPYFPAEAGFVSKNLPRAISRTELYLPLESLCLAAAWLLIYGGSFFLVHKPERLCDLFWHLRRCRLEPKRLRFVRHIASDPISLVLIEARLGAKAGLSILPDLVLLESDGQPTNEYREIYHF